jgi:hypothetical protein
MVCTTIGNMARLPLPGITYIVNKNGLQRFYSDIFYILWAPIDKPTQTNGGTSTYQSKISTRWISYTMQTEISGIKEQAIQTQDDVSAPYRMTAYWLEKWTGHPNPTERGDHIEPYWQVAIHYHGLDHLGLNSGSPHGFSNSDCNKYEAAQLAILNLDYCSYHDKKGDHKSANCLCPYIKCLPHWEKCYVLKTHLYYRRGCLIDDTIEGVQQKWK